MTEDHYNLFVREPISVTEVVNLYTVFYDSVMKCLMDYESVNNYNNNITEKHPQLLLIIGFCSFNIGEHIGTHQPDEIRVFCQCQFFILLWFQITKQEEKCLAWGP